MKKKQTLQNMNRRDFLKGSLTTPLGLRAYQMLPAVGALSSFGAKNAAAQDEELFIPYFLHVHCDGGWDPTMVFDNKISLSTVSQESGWSLRTATGGIQHISQGTRPSVDTFFTNHGEGCAIINGLSAEAMTYDNSIINAMGATPDKQNRPVNWLTYYTVNLNPTLDLPHVIFDAPYLPGEYSSTTVRLSKDLLAEYTTALPGGALGNAGETALASFHDFNFKNVLLPFHKKSLDHEKMRALNSGYLRENSIRTAMIQAATTLGPQGADSDFLRSGKIALECFAAGHTQAATIQSGPRMAWDSRTNHFTTQTTLFENLFSDLNALFTHAASLDILDRMIVVVSSERGRAPRLNPEGGKDPWQYTSALVYGVGIQGGQTVGATDDALRGRLLNPFTGEIDAGGKVTITMKHLMAAIFLKIGIQYKRMVGRDVDPLTAVLTPNV